MDASEVKLLARKEARDELDHRDKVLERRAKTRAVGTSLIVSGVTILTVWAMGIYARGTVGAKVEALVAKEGNAVRNAWTGVMVSLRDTALEAVESSEEAYGEAMDARGLAQENAEIAKQAAISAREAKRALEDMELTEERAEKLAAALDNVAKGPSANNCHFCGG
jgi:hypothetical protein